jgi:hypothetical protein
MDFEEDMKNRFNYHAPTEAKCKQHEELREALHQVAYLARDMEPSREASLFVTKLEEAMFWGNAAIARH